MSYPKKNETVKMYEDEACSKKLKVDFKGWGKHTKHVYKANWIDLSHARNVVSARLWADVVKSRANYEELPEELRTSPNQGAVDGFPVKVYSQGIYQGRYTLNIPKDAWMANIDDSLDTHCILCGENYASGCFRATANIDGNDWTDEVHDTVPISIKTRWNEVIDFVMNSTDDEFKANLENYFFVDSLIDYFIFGMVSCGLDAFGKNQLYFTYDGVKWIASMYDMDSTWGLYWNGSKFVSASYARTDFEDFVSTSSSGDGNLLYIRLASLFYAEIKSRYEELKQGALSVPNIINHFERFTDIAPLNLVKEDYASTTGSGKFTGIPSQSTNNIQQIRQFVIDRYAYCDEYMESLTPEVQVPATGIALDKTVLTFNDSATQTLVATLEPAESTSIIHWSSSNQEVATVEKGIVTPIAKGTCTITATANNVSVTCEVIVNIEEIVTYSITRTLTNCTSSSSATTITDGSSHNETITANYGYSLEGATVSVQMGGEDISSLYDNGILSISNVTGDIVIEISAVDTNPYKWTSSASFGFDSSGNAISGNAYITENYIEVEKAKSYIFQNIDATFTYLSIYTYDENKTFISKITNNTRTNAIYLDVPEWSDIKYVRLHVYPNNVATNNNPIDQTSFTVAYENWSALSKYGSNNSNGDISDSGDNFLYLKYFTVSNGEIVTIANTNGAEYTWKRILAYQSDGTFVETKHDSGTTADLVYTAPENVAYLIILISSVNMTECDVANQIVMTKS